MDETPTPHVLRYLMDPDHANKAEGSVSFEYRLLCSGTIHRKIIGDWSKSDVARPLLAPPLMLYAASRPIDDYPAELVLTFGVERVTETTGSTTTIFCPDSEIARDLAALLTLVCRRLITVSGKCRERYPEPYHTGLDYTPLPITKVFRRVCWPPLPVSVLTSFQGQEVHDNNPPPLAVDPARLTTMLLGLPGTEHADTMLASARLYALALELIREQPDLSYQLLISAVETLANGTLRSFQPTDEEKVAHQSKVFRYLTGLGIESEVAKKAAIAACDREYWVKKKFRKFLADNIDEAFWSQADDLFQTLPNSTPSRDEAERVFGIIYDTRSKATHHGQAFPASATYDGGPWVDVKIVASLLGPKAIFPPVVWFERVVNRAIVNFWTRSVEAEPGADRSTAVIFQYGSNCLESQINGENRLRGDAKFIGIAHTVEDYQLAFDVLSKNRGCAASDIVPSVGSKVWGVLYEVPHFLIGRETAREKGRTSLDQIEGEGTNYERRSIHVKSPNGRVRTAITYTVIKPITDAKTNLEYVRHIVLGLREHGIPQEYIDNVKAIACVNNPSITTEVAAL